ncbi:hypothetical protein LMIY3S_03718 [Labrys miyagiensis]
MKDALKAVAFGMIGALVVVGLAGGLIFILYSLAAGFQH